MSARRAPWLVTGLLLAAAALLGWLIGERGDIGPRVVHAGLGDVVQVGDVYLAVESVRQTEVVITPSSWGEATEYEGAGTWLVVRLAYQGDGEPGTFSAVEWRDDAGRTFAVDQRPMQGVDAAQPGQWLVSDVVLEITPGQALGGEVILSPRASMRNIPFRQGVIRVPAEAIESAPSVELLESVWVENASG